MGADRQQQRYDLLREREEADCLTDAERAELAALVQALDDREAAYLAPSNERMVQEIAAMEAAVERVEGQNRRLRDYLQERQAFLARVKSLVDDIRTEDRRMRERYAEVLPLVGEEPDRKPS
jgi:hypothetical protein